MPDEIDLRILQLLTEDARRPYSEVADRVDLSPPAVSERVRKLEEHGIIRRFTLDFDRSQLREGTPVLVTLTVDPAADDLRETLLGVEGVEHVLVTADARVVVHAHAPTEDVRSWLFSAIDADSVRDVDVRLLVGADRAVGIGGGTAFALTCVECGNDVGPDGVTRRIDGDLKSFCCSSCETLYVERYEELSESAD
jgi:Lrp/AsnC family transcriptional regulator, leucine-responsive regulatory protein